MNDTAQHAARFQPTMRPSEFLAEWLREPGLTDTERAVFDAYYVSYRRRFPALVRRSYDRRLAPALEVLRGLPKSARVLEIGAGCGTESLYYALQGYDVTALDVLKMMVDTAKARKRVMAAALGREPTVQFHHIDVLRYEAPAPFDLIWIEEAFHHMEPRRQVVAKIAALLKPGGHLIIAETNPFNLLVQAYLLRDRGLPHVKKRNDESGTPYMYGAERVLMPYSLDRWFRAQGITMTGLQYHRLFPNSRLGGPWVERVDVFAHRWLPHFLKRFCCVHYNYVGVKASASATPGA